MSTKQSNAWVLAPLFLVLVIDTMGFGVIFPILGPMFLGHSNHFLPADTSQVVRQLFYGGSLLAFSLTMFFGATFLGDLSDKIGRKKVLLICLSGTAISLLISAVGIEVRSVAVFMLGRLCAGFCAGSQPIAQAAIADISTEANKAVNLGFIIFANCLGFIIGPIFGGYFADASLSSWFGYQTPFFAAAILAAINAMGIMVTLRETYAVDASKKLHLLKGLTVFVSAFKHPKVRLLSVVMLLFECGWSVYFMFVSLFLVNVYHYNSIKIGHFMAYYGVIWAITLTVIVRLAVKFLRIENIVLLSIIVSAAAVLLCFVKNIQVFWLLALPLGIGSGLVYTGLVTVYSNVVNKDQQGWVMGIASAIVAAAWGIGSMLAGVLGNVSAYFPFVITFIFMLLSAIAMLLFQVQQKKIAHA